MHRLDERGEGGGRDGEVVHLNVSNMGDSSIIRICINARSESLLFSIAIVGSFRFSSVQGRTFSLHIVVTLVHASPGGPIDLEIVYVIITKYYY